MSASVDDGMAVAFAFFALGVLAVIIAYWFAGMIAAIKRWIG